MRRTRYCLLSPLFAGCTFTRTLLLLTLLLCHQGFSYPTGLFPLRCFQQPGDLALLQAAALAAARRGEAAERRQQEGVNEAAADAVRGAVGHMLRVLMENLETKSRTYKNKVCASLECAPLQDPPAADLVPSMWMCFLHVFHFIVMGTHN